MQNSTRILKRNKIINFPIIRGNNLFGLNFNMNYNSEVAADNLTYTPLLYANGPGRLPEIRTYNLTENITCTTFFLICLCSLFGLNLIGFFFWKQRTRTTAKRLLSLWSPSLMVVRTFPSMLLVLWAIYLTGKGRFQAVYFLLLFSDWI